MMLHTYQPPSVFVTLPLGQLLLGVTRSCPSGPTKTLDCTGDLSLLHRRCIAIVGSRRVTEEGYRRARKIGWQLAKAGIVVVSGLAEGVDTAALDAAMEAGGRVIGVIGTPLERVYPAFNQQLQETIGRDHLLISEFRAGSGVKKENFPERNRTMAALSDGTLIVEAADTSGTLHQARECQRLGRHLFVLRSAWESSQTSWQAEFKGYVKLGIVSQPSDVIDRL